MAKRATIEDIRPVLTEFDKVVDVADETIDKVEQAIDHGVETVEHVVETGVHAAAKGSHIVVRFLRSPKTAAVIILGVSVAGAGYVGWKLAHRHYAKQFEQELSQQIESARDFYARMNKAGEYATAEGAASALIAEVPTDEVEVLQVKDAAEALKSYQGRVDYTKPEKAAQVEEDEPVVVKSNVFVNGAPLDPDAFDYDEELAKRSEDVPYVISFEEYMQNASNYPQTTFTYFEGDDILTDERDEIIQDVEHTVGSDNLAKFGHGSKDPNVVYIRNEKIEIDFEVTRSEGKYGEEVAGFEGSGSNNVARRFRPGDDG